MHPHLTNRALRTPRAAAIAGIIFAVLQAASIVLLKAALPDSLSPTEWVTTHSNNLSIAMSLLPFAGISFLWFMGVVRDRLGEFEDQFFATLYLGSGLLYLAMSFAAAAVMGAFLTAYEFYPEAVLENGVYAFSYVLVQKLNSVYAIRMAGMHMMASGTIWVRTQVMPRWLAITTYILALILLFGIGLTGWANLIFPAWVFVISLIVLHRNYRIEHDNNGQIESVMNVE
jgi:hypothetical protein